MTNTGQPTTAGTQSTDPSKGPRLGWLFAPSMAFLAIGLSVLLFAPRYHVWALLDLPPSTANPPEVNRAIDVLRQLEDPSITITNEVNRVINWRILFPWIGHFLKVPPLVFLLHPFVGCFVTLVYLVIVTWRITGDRLLSGLATILIATASWFFVSTGWLSYGDSWIILGLLILSFSPSRVAPVVSTLIAPWIDERFILAVPLSLMVRSILFRRSPVGDPIRLRNDWLRCLIPVIIYAGLRVVAILSEQDEGSVNHLREHVVPDRNWRELLRGQWAGLRSLWVSLGLAVLLSIRKVGWLSALALLLTIIMTVGLNIALARDLSRSASTLVPAALLGLCLLGENRRQFARLLTAVLVAVNLLLPAEHVIANWGNPVPIQRLDRRLQYDAAPMLAQIYAGRGVRVAQEQEWSEAIRLLNRSLQYRASVDVRDLMTYCRDQLELDRGPKEEPIRSLR